MSARMARILTAFIISALRSKTSTQATEKLEKAAGQQLTAKDGLDMEMAAGSHRNFEMKWAGPDGVVIDISHTGWDNGP